MPGNDHFYNDDRAECPDEVCYMGFEKFLKKNTLQCSHFI